MPLSRVAPHLFGHTKIYNMGVSISRHILPISHIALKTGSHHGMPCPSMVITLGTMDVGTERKDAVPPQDSCATLESHNIKSRHMVNKL